MNSLRIRVRGPKGILTVGDLYQETTWRDLQEKLREASGIAVEKMQVLSGYPPQEIQGPQNATLKEVGIVSGSTLTLREIIQKEMQNPQGHQNQNAFTNAKHGTSTLATSVQKPIMVRRVVDADNSCLFNSIGYVMGFGIHGNGPALRNVIASVIRSNPKQYSAAILGRSIEEYCNWICLDTSWGGEVELSILADHFQIQIIAFDIRSLTRLCYGSEKEYPNMAYVLYDGIHYDAIAESPGNDMPKEYDTTQFPAYDISKIEQAFELVKEAHQCQQFTDVSGFLLRCLVCNQGLRGQREAQEHAQQTGHQNFGELTQ